MPKPKPPSPAELARQAAEKELPGLRKALEDMLDQPIPVDEIIQPEHDTASGDAKLDDGEEDKDSENNEVVDPDNEDADSEDEEWGEVDEEEYEEGYEEGLEEDVDTSFQKVEVLGVCVVTEALIKETLGIYNKDAIRWIEKNDVLITEQGQRAANLAYPWVLRVLGSHREFSLNGSHLSTGHHTSFPKSLLQEASPMQDDRFKVLHAIVFSANPALAQCYVTAASVDSSATSVNPNHRIPSTSIHDCLKEVENEPGIYGYQFDIPTGKYYIGRSKDIKKRLAEHFKPYGGVNNLIRQAKAKEKEAGKNGEYHWPNGAIVTFDSDAYGYVPTGIWSAIETSLIACHGSTLGSTRPQINIVDGCCLPRPPLSQETIEELHKQYIAGVELSAIYKDFNIEPAYIRLLLTGKRVYKDFMSRPGLLRDWLALQKLRVTEPHRSAVINDRCGKIMPLYPRIPDIEVGIPQKKLRERVLTGIYPLRPRGTSEAYTLQDYCMEVPPGRSHWSDPSPVLPSPVLPSPVLPLEKYKKLALEKYAEAFAAGIPNSVWNEATAPM